MKFLKILGTTLISILLIASALLTTAGTIWYTLPDLATTSIGRLVTNNLSNTAIFWTTIGSAITFVLSFIGHKLISRNLSSKFKNFFIHLTSWLITGVAIALALYGFFCINPMVSSEIVITLPKKIIIGVTFAFLILFYILSNKIMKIINRKIQAYENSKELNVVGRGSIIIVNLLKLFEILFPEMLILLLICMCVSINVAIYFIIILVAFAIPMIANIDCDLTIRKEIRKNQDKDKDELVKSIAKEVKGVRK